ncbi:hypothetical protein [Burkholderia oklahomensis]|nr:hypothetical protein [Burkholderia oklahomensis]
MLGLVLIVPLVLILPGRL